MEIREKERFWLEERRKRVRGYDRELGREEPHKLRGSMNSARVRGNQELGKIKCVFRCMMR